MTKARARKIAEYNAEAMDRAYCQYLQVVTILADHRGVTVDKKAKKLADTAINALWKLYQYLGRKT